MICYLFGDFINMMLFCFWSFCELRCRTMEKPVRRDFIKLQWNWTRESFHPCRGDLLLLILGMIWRLVTILQFDPNFLDHFLLFIYVGLCLANSVLLCVFWICIEYAGPGAPSVFNCVSVLRFFFFNCMAIELELKYESICAMFELLF